MDTRKIRIPFSHQTVESLMYLSMGTRQWVDIIFAVNKASQYLEKLNKIHWNAVKRIFKYLMKQQNMIFIFNQTE